MKTSPMRTRRRVFLLFLIFLGPMFLLLYSTHRQSAEALRQVDLERQAVIYEKPLLILRANLNAYQTAILQRLLGVAGADASVTTLTQAIENSFNALKQTDAQLGTLFAPAPGALPQPTMADLYRQWQALTALPDALIDTSALQTMISTLENRVNARSHLFSERDSDSERLNDSLQILSHSVESLATQLPKTTLQLNSNASLLPPEERFPLLASAERLRTIDLARTHAILTPIAQDGKSPKTLTTALALYESSLPRLTDAIDLLSKGQPVTADAYVATSFTAQSAISTLSLAARDALQARIETHYAALRAEQARTLSFLLGAYAVMGLLLIALLYQLFAPLRRVKKTQQEWKTRFDSELSPAFGALAAALSTLSAQAEQTARTASDHPTPETLTALTSLIRETTTQLQQTAQLVAQAEPKIEALQHSLTQPASAPTDETHSFLTHLAERLHLLALNSELSAAREEDSETLAAEIQTLATDILAQRDSSSVPENTESTRYHGSALSGILHETRQRIAGLVAFTEAQPERLKLIPETIAHTIQTQQATARATQQLQHDADAIKTQIALLCTTLENWLATTQAKA